MEYLYLHYGKTLRISYPMEHLGLATFTQPIKETILVVHVGGHVYVNSSLYVHSLKTNRWKPLKIGGNAPKGIKYSEPNSVNYSMMCSIDSYVQKQKYLVAICPLFVPL